MPVAGPTATACPVCGCSARVPYYDRPLAACAECGALERQRALARDLSDELVPGGGGRCLEIAPLNPRVFRGYLRSRGWEYEALDKRLLRERRDPGGFDDFIDHDRDLSDLRGIDSAGYALVMLQHVLGEVADDKGALDEIARVVEPGGRALLEIPWKPESARTRRIDRDRYGNRRAYGRDVLDDLLARFADVELRALTEGLYSGTVFICRARSAAPRAESPLGTGHLEAGAPLRPVAIDEIAVPVSVGDRSWTRASTTTAISRGAGAREDVRLREFPVVCEPQLAGQLRQMRARYASYAVRRIFMMSIPRCSLAGSHLVAVQDGRYVEETIRGSKSFADPRAFARGQDGWPAIAPGASHATLDEPVVAVGAKAAAGFFHWMTEVVPRLVAVLERGDLRSLPLLMRPATLPFQEQTLAWLGITPRFVGEDVVHVQRAVIPSYPIHSDRGGRYSPELIELARRFCEHHVPAFTGELPRRVYVSRRDARVRRVANEQQVEETLSALGFQTVVLTGMALEQQIRTIAGAEFVVAQHGAGLTHLMFARPGTRVIELYPRGFLAPSPYWTLSSLADLEYAMLVCDLDAAQRDSARSTKQIDIHVDVGALSTLVSQNP